MPDITVDTIAVVNGQSITTETIVEANNVENQRAVENFMRWVQTINVVEEEDSIVLGEESNAVVTSDVTQTDTADARRYKNFHRKQLKKAAARRVKQRLLSSGGDAEALQ